MTSDIIKRTTDSFKAMIPAAQTGPERIAVYLAFVKEVAADRARILYLALEAEAERCVATEEPAALRCRLEATIAQASSELARTVGDSIAAAKDNPADREPFERLAQVAFRKSFDGLRTSPKGGSA